MHDHKHCHHVLQYCEHCDVAYCEKCGKEWRNRPHYYYYYPYRWETQTVVANGNVATPYTINITGDNQVDTDRSVSHVCT